MHCKSAIHTLLCSALFLPVASIMHRPTQTQVQGYSIDLSLTNFETGVARSRPESFVTAKVACRFDDWDMIVSWGDGNTEHLTHSASASLPGPSTPAGTYPLYSAHSYSKAGPYSATAELWVHCYGSTGGKGRVDQKPYNVSVYDRLPLNTLTLSAASVKRGSTVDVTAQTFADAPASGTRVDLTANKAGVFGSGTLAEHSDIPEKSKTTTTTLKVLGNSPLGPVVITATAGSKLTKTVTITP